MAIHPTKDRISLLGESLLSADRFRLSDFSETSKSKVKKPAPNEASPATEERAKSSYSEDHGQRLYLKSLIG